MTKEATLDLKDRRILDAIEMKGRFFTSDIAKRVGLSKEVVAYRLSVLEKKGIITGYHAIINLTQLAKTPYLLAINLMDVTKEDTDAILAFLQQEEEVVLVQEADVLWDLLFHIVVKDNMSFLQFLDRFNKRFKKFIEKSQVSIILEEEYLSRRYILGKDKPEKDQLHSLSWQTQKSDSCDATDAAIIRALVSDAQTPLLTLAKQLKLDSMTIKRRIDRLEKEEIIIGYMTSLNLKSLGITTFCVRLTLSDTERLRAMTEYVRHLPETVHFKRDIGGYDFSFDIDVPSQTRFEEIIVELRRQFPVVREVEHFTILRTHKNQLHAVLS